MDYRTIVVSDLHLGAPDSKYEQLIDFLQKNTCEHLILNGDIIDGLYLKFFPKTRNTKLKKALDTLISISDTGTQITYLQGNHDRMRHKNTKLDRSHISITTELKYKSGDKTYLICHGQQLDNKAPYRIEYSGFLAGVFVFWVNRGYNKWRASRGLAYQSIVAKIKDFAKMLMTGGGNSIDKKIEKICKHHKVNGFICGHLHHASDRYIGTFHYLNSGDRVESMTALVETHDHQRSIYKY